jgi:hypothetical protein
MSRMPVFRCLAPSVGIRLHVPGVPGSLISTSGWRSPADSQLEAVDEERQLVGSRIIMILGTWFTSYSEWQVSRGTCKVGSG